MAYAQAVKTSASAIPVIDIAPLRDGTGSADVARALHEASHGLGFIYVKGHGIPEEIINDARSTAFEFFRADPVDKAAVKVSKAHRGWIGQGGAKMGDKAKPDLKESFIWGYQDAAGDVKNDHPQNDHPLRGDNQWPAFLPEMQDHAMTYFKCVHDVAHHLMHGFALGLDLDKGFFLKTASRPLSRASFVYYPSQPQEMGAQQFGVGAHTDFGVLTVLCQDDVGGLQVQTADGEWIEAPPVPGSLIVNVGDLLCRWTDGAYKSTPHRVVNSSGRERLSLVLAFDPDPQTMIDPCEVFGACHVAKNQPITCGDYLTWRFDKAFSYRKE